MMVVLVMMVVVAVNNHDLKQKLAVYQEKEKTFHYEGGIKEYVEYLNKGKSALYPEVIYCEGEKNGVYVEVAMQHNDGYNEGCYSFVNNITTPEGGTHLVGFKNALTKIFNDVLDFNIKNQMKIILFIDEFHMIISNAGCDSGVSMHDILKPYLTNNNLIVIGATTVNEYNKYVKKDVALMRRITPIFVNKLSDTAIVDILDNFSNHEVKRELLENILSETKNIPNTTNPDISLEILDRVLAKHEVLGCDINMKIINKEIFKLKECYECL